MFNYFVKKRKKKGFTLVELLVVVAIVAVLAVVAVPRLSSMTDGARMAAMEGNVDAIKAGLILYAAENGGKLPKSTEIDNIAEFIGDLKKGDKVLEHFNDRPAGSKYTWDGKVLTATMDGITNPDKYIGDGSTKRAGEVKSDGTYTITFNA